MAFFSLAGGLAMDLGTANTLIYQKRSGIVLNEPSVVALESASRKVLAVGHEAKPYLGRTPVGIEVIRPLKSGVIYDFAVTQQMIRSFLEKAGINNRILKPKVVIGVPSGSTQSEKAAIIEAAEQAGGKSIRLVDEPMAAAIGLGLPVAEISGQLVLDVGGGTSEGVVISQGAAMAYESLRVAGDEATEAIIRYLQLKYQLAVGENTAEDIKKTIGSTIPLEEILSFRCRGKDLIKGVPKVVELNNEDIREAFSEISVEFINMVKRLISQIPEERAEDVKRQGLHLTGGGSILKGLQKRLSQETGYEVISPENPLISVVLGLGLILENMNYYKSVFVN